MKPLKFVSRKAFGAFLTGVIWATMLAAPSSAATQELALSPPSASANLNSPVKLSARFREDGVGVEGASISFVVESGPNAGDPLGPCTTDTNGLCAVTLVGDDGAGTDLVRNFLDTDTDGVFDAGEPTDTSEITWVALPPDACLDAELEGVLNPAGAENVLTVTVTDARGNPNDDACEGSPVAGLQVSAAIIDNDPDVFISSLNGAPTAAQGDSQTLVTDETGSSQLGVTLVDADAIGDGRNEIRFVITGISGVTDASATSDTEPAVDRIEMFWEAAADTTAPTIADLQDSPDPFTPNGDGRKDKTKISFSVSEDATVTITVEKKKNGRVVRALREDAVMLAGSNSVKWNGRNNKGNLVPLGKYVYRVVATDAAGNTSQTVSGVVTVKG